MQTSPAPRLDLSKKKVKTTKVRALRGAAHLVWLAVILVPKNPSWKSTSQDEELDKLHWNSGWSGCHAQGLFNWDGCHSRTMLLGLLHRKYFSWAQRQLGSLTSNNFLSSVQVFVSRSLFLGVNLGEPENMVYFDLTFPKLIQARLLLVQMSSSSPWHSLFKTRLTLVL